MLAISVRVRPCSDLLTRSSSGRATSRAPSSARATVIGAATVWLRVPLGPLTVTRRSSRATSTPDGGVMGSLPIRDMPVSPLGPSSPDVGEDFPTHALLVRLAVGQQTLARRDDRDAESAEHLRQAGVLGVDPQARLRDPADAGDRALAVLSELEGDHEGLADGAAVGALGGVLHRPGGDVALLLEDLRDAGLQLAVRHRHRVVLHLVGFPQTCEHVCERVYHRHGREALSHRGFALPDGRATFSDSCLRRTWMRGCGALPAALGDARQLAAVRHLAHADPAEAELAEHGPRPAAALAARVALHLELRLPRRLDLQ